MEALSFHSNQSSYPIGTKTQLFVPPAYRCYMWNLVRIGVMASEEMSFENVDGRRMTDGRRMPAYTISSPISLRLRWAKTGTLFTVFPTKSTHIHYVLSLYFTPNHSVSLSDLRKPILFPLKCHFSDPKRWQRCALPSLKKVPFLVLFFFFLFKHRYQVD